MATVHVSLSTVAAHFGALCGQAVLPVGGLSNERWGVGGPV